jgi:hypothetical protein
MSDARESDNLQKYLDMALYEQQKNLMVALAIHFSPRTKICQVPPYTIKWRVRIMEQEYPWIFSKETVPYTEIMVDLIPFFGMHVGYLVKTDTMYLWTPESR